MPAESKQVTSMIEFECAVSIALARSEKSGTAIVAGIEAEMSVGTAVGDVEEYHFIAEAVLSYAKKNHFELKNEIELTCIKLVVAKECLAKEPEEIEIQRKLLPGEAPACPENTAFPVDESNVPVSIVISSKLVGVFIKVHTDPVGLE